MTRASTRPGWKDLFTNAQLSRERPSCTVNAKQHICFSIALTGSARNSRGTSCGTWHDALRNPLDSRLVGWLRRILAGTSVVLT